MNDKSTYVAFSNQKGGVGKSGFTTLVASYLHYSCNRNVVVIDCDYPQHTISSMRERDIEFVGISDFYKDMLVAQHQAINKRAYPVFCSKPEDAIEFANKTVRDSKEKIDVVFFDLSGTVNSYGILTSMLSLDYLFCPITMDKSVMHSSLTFVSLLKECMKKNPKISLKGVYLFWNQLVKSEHKELYDSYNYIMKQLGLNKMETDIPFTVKYKREMTKNNSMIFRSTLFPANKALIKGTNFDLLVKEMCKIIKLNINE
jgi:cellulose biosynthesis protein BcsQ